MEMLKENFFILVGLLWNFSNCIASLNIFPENGKIILRMIAILSLLHFQLIRGKFVEIKEKFLEQTRKSN